MNFENLQQKKRLNFVQYGMALAFLFTRLMTLPLNAQIIADGNEHTVDAIGQTLDVSLPNNPNIAYITFKLVGGDGGYAQVLDHIGGKVVKADGGAGVFITATFPVGNGPNEIPPGSIFRFMEGRSGQNGSSDAILGKGVDFGGGGGGSGILYKKTISSPYKLLAVAGGGGGAHQGMFAGLSTYHEPGQSGRTGTSGGSGNGSQYFNAGGMDGHDVGNGSLGDGGGVRTATSSLRTSAYTHEDCDNCDMGAFGFADIQRTGGTGYGCGGHGLGVSFFNIGTGTGGGGGGGYSGGGFGGIVGRGGGGGSYVNPIATSHSSSDQGTDPTPDHGWITYQVTLNQRPVAQCKSATIYLDEYGLATLYTSDVDFYSSDPDGSIVKWSLSKTQFDCTDIGSNQVTLTVTDNMGSKATCEANANMMDARAPTALCRDITVQLDAAGVATIDGEDVDGGSSDNCSIATRTVTPNTFDCSNIGSPVTVTLTVTDGSGNSSSCTSTVTVEDNVPPVAMCKDLIIQLDASGNASITGAEIDNGSNDACGIDLLTPSQTSFTCADVGDNTVTLTVTDVNGNISICTSTVTVEDNVPPDAMCKDLIIQLNASGNASITGAEIDNGSNDACGIASLAPSKATFTCADVGVNTVSLSVTDVNGNTSTCTSSVTVEDNVPPVAMCKDLIIQLDASGNALITGAEIDNGSNDACGIASLTPSQASFTCADVGDNTVILTVTDVNGNTSTCTSTITVEDNVPPEALCKNITIQLDVYGNASITGADIDNGSNDACGIASLTPSQASFTCADLGANTVILTVTDVNGNTSTCTSTVTVEDNVPPEALCKNITIQLDASGNASITGADIDNGSNDACGIASYVVSKTDFTCADLGINTLTLTVTDVNGSNSSCETSVAVEDNIIPIVRTRNVTVVLDNEGVGNVTPQMIDHGSTDNCTIVDMWLEGETDYDCGNTGEHEVVLKARDQSENIGSWNAFVTVKFYEPDFNNIHSIANGDTIHRVNCQVPWDISSYDLDYKTISKHGKLTTHIYKKELPENVPWGMYGLWRYEYVVKDACAHTYKFNYYLALYDLTPPIYQNFPNDTTVAGSSDLPPVDMKVKIIDVCQYVEWDTVITMPVLDLESGDTLGFTRRWMARDPSGHESFKDQMIWLGSGGRDQYSLITGRIADEDHIVNARFTGEAGTNGLPVSLYRLDEGAGTRTWVSSWTTGDWMGAQGTYYFVPNHPGSYQVKIDTAICLVDTLKFNKWLWSDTLVVAAGESLDQGWMITQDCIDLDSTILEEAETLELQTERDQIIQNQIQPDKEWRVYPNPADRYLHLDIQSEQEFDYQLFDILGRLVKFGKYHQGHSIDVRGLNTGMYYLQLSIRNHTLGTKSVILNSEF